MNNETNKQTDKDYLIDIFETYERPVTYEELEDSLWEYQIEFGLTEEEYTDILQELGKEYFGIGIEVKS